MAVALLLAVSPAAAHPGYVAANYVTYVSQAANRIIEIHGSSAELTTEEKGQIAGIACQTFSELFMDKNFRADVDQVMSGPYRNNSVAAHSLLESVQSFQSAFVDPEWKALRSQGFDPLSTLDAISLAAAQRMRGISTEMTSKDLLNSINQLAEASCRLRKQVVTDIQTTNIMIGIFGTVFIVGDIGVVIDTGLAAAPVAAASISAGEPIVANAATRLTR